MLIEMDGGARNDVSIVTEVDKEQIAQIEEFGLNQMTRVRLLLRLGKRRRYRQHEPVGDDVCTRVDRFYRHRNSNYEKCRRVEYDSLEF